MVPAKHAPDAPAMEEPFRPEHECYQVQFTDTAGRTNRRPIRYRIEVTRDLPPEVHLVEGSPALRAVQRMLEVTP